MIKKDKTTEDIGRTDINLHRAEVDKLLPEYFAEDHPKLLELFYAYYEFMDLPENPNGYLHQLNKSRDATQVPEPLLEFLEDELLLGQAYFGGFLNKREAIKFSNLLFRSKGTKYSIEQFFRAFYGIDVGVTYPKDNIFIVGPKIDVELSTTNDAGGQIKSEAGVIGPESRKYLTDDKLYQIYSVLIRAGISVKDWIDVYKLFVHPAGMYLGSELLIEIVNAQGISIIQEDAGLPIEEQLTVAASASFDMQVVMQETFIGEGDASLYTNGIRMDGDTFYTAIDTKTIEEVNELGTIAEIISPNSFLFDRTTGTLFDQDSDNGVALKSQFDQHKYSTVYDSDGSTV